MIRALQAFCADESGHTAIEYTMIIAVGALAIITAIVTVGDNVQDMFTKVDAAWHPQA